MKFKTKTIVFLGVFIAFEFFFSRVITAMFPTLFLIPGTSSKISLAFVPLSMCGWLLGPIPGLVCGVVSDILGATLMPTGPFYFGYTITNGLRGLVYGLILYKCGNNLGSIALRSVIASAVVVVFLNLGLNSLWDVMFFSNPFWVNVAKKIPSNAINLVLYITVITLYIKAFAHTDVKRFFK